MLIEELKVNHLSFTVAFGNGNSQMILMLVILCKRPLVRTIQVVFNFQGYYMYLSFSMSVL